MDRIFSDARLDERGGGDSSDSSHVRKRLTSLCGEAIFLESKKMFKMRALWNPSTYLQQRVPSQARRGLRKVPKEGIF